MIIRANPLPYGRAARTSPLALGRTSSSAPYDPLFFVHWDSVIHPRSVCDWIDEFCLAELIDLGFDR